MPRAASITIKFFHRGWLEVVSEVASSTAAVMNTVSGLRLDECMFTICTQRSFTYWAWTTSDSRFGMQVATIA
jgi:hypothetical protein